MLNSKRCKSGSQERLWPNVKLGCVQTCGSVAVSHGHQAADGPLPALFGRHVEHTLHLQSNNDDINTTIDPEQVPPSALEDSTGGKSCSEIRADAAETDGCNNAPKTPGGSSDTLQMKDADSGNTRPLSQRRSSRTEVKEEKEEERKRNGWWQRVNQPLQLRNVTAINKTQRMN